MWSIHFCTNEWTCIAYDTLLATVMATKTSLTLEGKAYKWWMSLPTDICPKTWEEFEAAFRKEFLLLEQERQKLDDLGQVQDGRSYT